LVPAAGTSSETIEALWQPPEQDNGAMVTSYVLEYAPAKKVGASACWQLAY
jgi:hypothetical protein